MQLSIDSQMDSENRDDSHKVGWRNAHPSPGNEVVISGISGSYPQCRNIHEFRDNLAAKVDMVSSDERRWEIRHPDIPQRFGKIEDVHKFDAGFFGVHPHQCAALDPMCRILMEKCFECQLDAGYNPIEIEGTNTAVYIAISGTDSENYWLYETQVRGTKLACARSMVATYIAYAFKLQGEAQVVDTACSGSSFALDHAYRAIREGRCDRAIVAGANLCLLPQSTMQYFRLGALCQDGMSKSFQETADGYVRSEAICAIFVEKGSTAKRVYAELKHSKCNSDGYTEQGITYPSGAWQGTLMREVYLESGVDVNDVTFLEAHATGTAVGDPEELGAIFDVFLKSKRPPLHVGTVKSNIGHSEGASGLCSVSKVLLCFEDQKILPNIQFSKYRKELCDGPILLATENMPWPNQNGLAGVNNSGYGGSNCHALLKWNEKSKVTSKMNLYLDVPMLVCVSGRTPPSVEAILKDVRRHWNDAEYMRLLHDIFRYNIPGYNYRSFIKISKDMKAASTDITWHSKKQTKLVYVFSESQISWIDIIKDLSILRPFARAITKLQKAVISLGYDFKHTMTGFRSDMPISVCAQIAIADTLSTLGLYPDAYFGSNLVSAYLENGQNLEAILKSAFRQNYGDNQENIVDQQSAKWISKKRFQYIARKCTVIHFGCHTSISNAISILPSRGEPILQHFLTSLGKIYVAGFPLCLHELYPSVEFPVARGTPMISPAIRWNHKRDWFVVNYRNQCLHKKGLVKLCINAKDEFWKFLTGHMVDGRNVIPGTMYLVLVWDALAILTAQTTASMRIVFENVKFVRMTILPASETICFTITIQAVSGEFEVVENNGVVATGTIRETDEEVEAIPNSDEMFSQSPTLLTEADIYTELKLRGYNYRAPFCALKQMDLSGCHGAVEWSNNWAVFLDSMLQWMSVMLDTRNVCVPSGIKRLQIDACELSRFKKGDNVSVYADRELKIIRSVGVEIRGIVMNVLNTRKCPNVLLERYVFVPNEAQLTIKNATRVILQVALENFSLSRLKIIEDYNGNADELICPLLKEVLNDIPMIDGDLRVYAKEKKLPLDHLGIVVVNEAIANATESYMIIVDCFTLKHDKKQLEICSKSLVAQGYLLVKHDHVTNTCLEGYSLLLQHRVSDQHYLSLFQKDMPLIKEEVFVKYEETGEFLTKLQNLVSSGIQNMLLYSDEVNNGLLGAFMCLKKELVGQRMRCLIVDGECNPTDFHLYEEHLRKGFVVNVMREGCWGTYRFLPISDTSEPRINAQHILATGDISKLAWIEGPLKNDDPHVVQVRYAALNFRDVMIASGRLSLHLLLDDSRLNEECMHGIEYAGLDTNGRRVMGMTSSGALASLVQADPDLLLYVPAHWSLQDAVTVPTVYSTVIYAFQRVGGLLAGQSILIHSGSGGVGQAAISVALFHKCEVFVTVGSPEKKDYLCNKFSSLKRENIGNSRETTFEQFILNRTNHRGVDIVLNSLSEDKLRASLRCLADNGHHLEIGKFDLGKDNELEIELLQRGITFHGVNLDDIFKQLPSKKQELMARLQAAINDGVVTPLERTLFQKDELEKAFRYMASGVHTGKIVVQMREDCECLTNEVFPAVPRFYCPQDRSCLVVGGLGGFGLQLCDWLVIRGCRDLVITSRNGCKTGNQHYKTNLWRSYGTRVTIVREDLQNEESCCKVLKMIPNAYAIFNLAVVLRDGLLENQTEEKLKIVLNSKTTTTKLLDRFSRQLNPDLHYFVTFSSVASGRGNIGQINYGMANSAIERIMEQRVKEGLHGLAIQWGPIADVGIYFEMVNYSDRGYAGYTPQKMFSCIEVMDTCLANPCPVVSSIILLSNSGQTVTPRNMFDSIVNIIGVCDPKCISWHSKLSDFGMDSIIAVEVMQTLEFEYDISLSTNEIRNLTLFKLKELDAQNISKKA